MARLNTLVGLALLAALCAGAADSDMDRGTLQGLKALRVVVDAPKPETERDGLNTTDLKAQLEAKLRDAGIVVDEGANDFLGLTITSAKDRKNNAVSVGLGVYQVVVLRRDPKIKTVAETWGTATVTAINAKNLGRTASNSASELADRFLRAYNAANPR
jgi:hypothetical protein